MDELQPWSRAALYTVFVFWGAWFILAGFESGESTRSFWHLINLGFHEAGHLAFSPFGRFVSVLGGTLGQLLAPLAVTLMFLFRNRDHFAASLGLWWLGQSWMDCAPYINDALVQRMTLLNGGTGRDSPGYHDWNFLLNQMGAIQYHHGIAATFYGIGVTLMLVAFVWGGTVLFLQHRDRRLSSF